MRFTCLVQGEYGELDVDGAGGEELKRASCRFSSSLGVVGEQPAGIESEDGGIGHPQLVAAEGDVVCAAGIAHDE